MSLSTSRIIEAAIDLLNEEGISGLTMRKLAERLQVAAPSLYFHMKDKRELYGLITEYVCGLILKQIMPQDGLREICFIIRKEYRAINGLTRLFVLSPPVTKDRIALINLFFGKLCELGVAEEYLAVSGNLLNNYILSFVTDEEVWTARQDDEMNIPFKIGISDMDRQFAFGLQVIIKGLEEFQKNFLKPSEADL